MINFTVVGNEVICKEYPEFKKVFSSHMEAVNFVFDHHDELEVEAIKTSQESELNNKIVKLSWVDHNMEYNEFNEIAENVTTYLNNNNIELSSHFRIGNFCINGIPENAAIEIKNKFNATHIDEPQTLLTSNDIETLTIGDKVSIELNGMFGASENKGTVYAIEGNTVTIKKYRSKTQGWTLEAGQIATITKGWKKESKTA